MGMMIGTNPYKYKTKQEIKDIQGNTVARLTVAKAKKTPEKKKKLNYNFKKISKQITLARTTGGARRVITRARDQVVDLLRKEMSGKYDETEMRHAIIHARKMERIARKKMKHLEQEEKAKSTGKALVEKGEDSSADEKKIEKAANGLSKEELERMIAEYEELMREMEETGGLDEVMKEYMGASEVEMSPEDLDKLRKKHRADEMKEIVEADMKYLKALFGKLAREKQDSSSNSNLGVSLELEGMEVPIPEETAEAAAAEAAVEGAAVDVSV